MSEQLKMKPAASPARGSNPRTWTVRLAGVLLSCSLAGCASFLSKSKTDELTEADPPDLLYNQGLAYLNAGDVSKAGEKFKAIDEQHPYSDYARRSMIMSAYVNFRRGRYPETINEAKRYVTLFPASDDAAYAQYLIGESYFRQMTAVSPDDHEAHYWLGESLRLQDRSEDAISAYERAIEFKPSYEDAHIRRNSLLIQTHQFQRVAELLESAITQAPNSGRIAHLYARFLAACPDPSFRDGKRAVDLARRVVAARPLAEHLETLAMALAQNGQCDLARQTALKAIEAAKQQRDLKLRNRLENDLPRYRQNPCPP